VRRLTPGERVDLTDGAGLIAECVVAAARPAELDLTVCARRAEPPPQPRIAILQAIPKGDRGELAVELMTEAGADVIVPWAAQRSLARWISTAQQAAKQSRRSWFPEVTEQADLAAAARRISAAALAIVLDPDAPEPLSAAALPTEGEVVLVIGPEGGISPAENDAFLAAGAVRARLGPTVMRASSAGAVAAGVLLSRTARWA
jgi:16S rRNA (uracil1498-N3)-methyltransferase